jgi:hypothetical protein
VENVTAHDKIKAKGVEGEAIVIPLWLIPFIIQLYSCKRKVAFLLQ